MNATRSMSLAASFAALVLAPQLAYAGGDDEGAVNEDEVTPTDQTSDQTIEPAPEEVPTDAATGPRDITVTPPPAAMVPPQEVPPAEESYREDTGITSFGMGFTVGGGVTDFTDDDAQDITDVGGEWDARLIFGTRMPVAIEAAYVGTAQGIDALGLDPDAILVSNGLEGNLRINLSTYEVQPFIFGGAGWSHYDITNSDFNTSSVSEDDNVFMVPLGAGLSGHYKNFLVDARFTYRLAFDDNLIAPPLGSSDDPGLDNWMATARLGVQF